VWPDRDDDACHLSYFGLTVNDGGCIKPKGDKMTNKQARLIGTAIALVGGGVAANAKGLNINVGIVIIVITFVLFLAEYVRCQMPAD
jgi:hypothetical protein